VWWNKGKQAAHDERIAEAVTSQEYADGVLAKINSQDEEITQVVNRLQVRSRRNHFGEALTLAMERRNA
jgi:uncharacterized protein YciU (UPF0263 family)